MNKKKFHSVSSSSSKENFVSLSTKNKNSNRNIIQSINKLPSKIYKSNVIQIEKIKKRNKEINSLNDEIRLSRINSFIQEKKINQSLTSRKKLSSEKKSIAKYCSDLLNKHIHINQTKNNYEIYIKELKEDYEKISNELKIKIDEIELTNRDIENKINNGFNLIEKQTKEIQKKKQLIQILKKKVNDQDKLNSNREKFYNERYNKLKIKYENLQIKLSEIYDKLSNNGNIINIIENSTFSFKQYPSFNTNQLICQIDELKKKIYDMERNISNNNSFYDLKNSKKNSINFTSIRTKSI